MVLISTSLLTLAGYIYVYKKPSDALLLVTIPIGKHNLYKHLNARLDSSIDSIYIHFISQTEGNDGFQMKKILLQVDS